MAAPDPVLLRIGPVTVPCSPGMAVDAVLEASNGVLRIAGLDDTLNPAIIDPRKAAGFVAGLAAQPPETLSRIAGHEMSLYLSGLGLSAAAPTRPEDYARPFTLTIDDIQGRNVLAHISVAPDAGIARTRAGAARTALQGAEAEVTAAERAADGDRIGQARSRRGAIASAWRMNAAAWAEAAPNDSAAKSELAAARKAARDYAMPSGALPG